MGNYCIPVLVNSDVSYKILSNYFFDLVNKFVEFYTILND